MLDATLARGDTTASTSPHPGRLSVFGLTSRAQIPLLLPTRFDDLSRICDRFADVPVGERRLLRLRVLDAAKSHFDRSGPRLHIPLIDAEGETARGILHGAPDELREQVPIGATIVVRATIKPSNNGRLLAITEIVSDHWAGQIRPVYPSAGKHLSADEAREEILEALPRQRRAAAAHLRQVLSFAGPLDHLLASLGCAGWDLEALIDAAHRPPSLRHGTHAHTTLERMAALVGLRAARLAHAAKGSPRHFSFATMAARIQALPHTLTRDQHQALRAIYLAMRQETPARVLLNGDVGTGKTLTFGAVAATVLDEGGRVAILVPNTVLAEQVARELVKFWPDLTPWVATSDTEPAPAGAPFVIGTTAILHQQLGRLDLAIVDEQHKFARHQREHYTSVPTHLIEATATCIPRSLALAQLGMATIVELRERHCPQTIHTRMFAHADRAQLAADLRATIANGAQVLIVYPERGEIDPEGEPPAPGTTATSVADALIGWEKVCPGRVRGLTGHDTADTKAAILAEMREGKADLLIATTVVEVGVNLPKLRHVVIVMPERHGLATLHQIRGRVAREGGEGWADLYCPAPPSRKSAQRLNVMLSTTDGFEVAERDLELRGLGNLAPDSTKQSGADDYVVFNRPLKLEAVKAILPLWAALSARSRSKGPL